MNSSDKFPQLGYERAYARSYPNCDLPHDKYHRQAQKI
jgi:hypothetical protein